MKRIVAIVLLGWVTACTPLVIEAPFSTEEVSFINSPGAATLEGQAFLRQMGGGVVTCAGSGVILVPAGGYATELFTKAFGNRDGGLANVFVAAPESTPTDFETYTRKTQCDADGNFAFVQVPNGDYYVVSEVQWYVGDGIIPEGGMVGRRVSVRNGMGQRVIISG